jgi:hypothetical protein
MTREEQQKSCEEVAKRALEGIIGMYQAWRSLEEGKISVEYNGDTLTSLEEIEDIILSDPLSFQVRSGWCDGKEYMEPEEFCLLLSTGGPASRIIGDLGEFNAPENIQIQGQDWFTPWCSLGPWDYPEDGEEALQWYCARFTECM